MLTFALTGASIGEIAAKGTFILLPIALIIAAFWCTMASLYTLPFRSGRGVFLAALALSWWDVIRMIGFYLGGIVRLGVVLVGWVLSLLKLAGALVVGFLKLLFLRPFALFDWLSRQYFKPGVPWLAFLFILIWSALEATIFTFTLRPTVTDVLADLTRTELSSWLVTVILWPFLFILISGSFAGIQALLDAFEAKTPSRIIGTSIFEASIMFFEVLFLYRELISAITPWIYQQTGVQIGFVGTLVMASFGWIGIRSMKQPVETLSGGQRQGVAVARSAAFARHVVIMDEPTAALGVKESNMVLDLIRRVRDKGLPVILISHNMPHVFEVSDRIHIQRLGKRAAVVSPSEIKMSDAVAIMTGALKATAEARSEP